MSLNIPRIERSNDPAEPVSHELIEIGDFETARLRYHIEPTETNAVPTLEITYYLMLFDGSIVTITFSRRAESAGFYAEQFEESPSALKDLVWIGGTGSAGT